ncbi:YlbF family regulator [Allofustis seminis]|uniref:YlbF family regulator n=1 Tax=Allofustis seminis TaxID=166939 RepID=UPI00035C50D8|nr:YlbF family regulator [Allofustis seminis]
MAINIYDSVNQLEKDLRQSDQYQALVDVFKKIDADEEVSKLMDEFKKIQKDFVEKQQRGEHFNEEDQQRAMDSSKKMQENEITKELLAAEFQLNTLLQDINEAIYKPIRELYE